MARVTLYDTVGLQLTRSQDSTLHTLENSAYTSFAPVKPSCILHSLL